MANTMPKITIAFKNAADSFVSRSSRGAVAVIVCDAAAASGELHYELHSPTETPTTLTAANQTFINQAFIGSRAGRVSRVLVYVCGASETDFSTAYAWLATQRFSYLALPASAGATQHAACKTWLEAQRSQNGAIFKAVLPNYAGDSERIVNYITGSVKIGASTYTAAQFCARIAGILASMPVTQSVTYAELPEVEDVERLTATAMDTAVAAGKLLLMHDGQTVRVGTGVNSLTTIGTDQSEAMKKILIIECRDMIEEDLRGLCAEYIGQVKNTYDGRLTVLAAVKTYLETLEAMTVVQSGWTAEIDAAATRAYLEAAGIRTTDMDDDAVCRYDYGTSMFIAVNAKILDAIENIAITING